MAKPWTHSVSASKKFGGKPEDYIEIHKFMDSSKSTVADNRHRALTHNAWFISTVVERIFGFHITNSDGKVIPVASVAEQHVQEDLGFIPSAQDYLDHMNYPEWIEGRGTKPEKQVELRKAVKAFSKHEEREVKWK